MADSAAFVLRVLQELQAIDATVETASAEDAALILSRVDAALADLAARNVIYLADLEGVEDQHLDHVAMILAQKCARSFGAMPDYNAVEYAETRLRTISRITIGKDRKLRVDPALRSRRHLGTIQLR